MIENFSYSIPLNLNAPFCMTSLSLQTHDIIADTIFGQNRMSNKSGMCPLLTRTLFKPVPALSSGDSHIIYISLVYYEKLADIRSALHIRQA